MRKLMIAIALLGVAAAEGQAGTMPSYPTPGTINGAAYSFKATSDGDIVAWFVGKSAAYTSQVGLIVNGGSPIFGLFNTVSPGTSFNFGGVKKGDTLEFLLDITSPDLSPPYIYSDPSKNGPFDGGTGLQHIYSAAYDGGDGTFSPPIPPGTFIGFEDLPGPGLGDRDYNDHMFVFENTTILNPNVDVPEPATMTMLGIGLAGIAGYRLRRRKMPMA